MAFKLEYVAQISFVGAGAGPMETLTAPSLQGGGAGAQAKSFVANPAVLPVVLGSVGTFPANTLNATDVTTLLTAMTADLSTQINAALAAINTWPLGQP